MALANAGRLRHHDALVVTGAYADNDDEYYDDEYGEEAPYNPPGSQKAVPGSQ